MNRRSLVLAVCAIACLLSPQVTRADPPTVVRVWQGLGGLLGETLQFQADQFNTTHPNIRVEIANRPNSYGGVLKDFREAIVKGDPPEIAVVEVHSVVPLAARGETATLDGLIAGDKQFAADDLLPGTVQNLRWEGQLYGVPLNRSTPVLYLNKNRFRAAGLDPNQPPRTWSEFREVARKLTTDPERSYGFGATSNSWFFETLVYGAGGDLVTSDGKTSAFAAAGAKPLQVWADMIHRDKTARVAGREAFLRGEAAMSIESTALVSYYEAAANKFEVGTGFVPCLDGQRPGVATGGGVAVLPANLSPEKQQAAWQFLSSLVATMSTADLSRRTGYVPLRKSAVELLKKEGFYTQHPNFLTAVEQIQYARAMPVAPSWGSATYLVTKAMTECLQKDVPADAALKGITPLFDQILLRNKAAMK